MVSRRDPLVLNLPGSIPEAQLESLRSGLAPVVVQVPEDWCYHIRRSRAGRGWTARMRKESLPALFPEAPEALWLDQELDESGAWEVWAISRSRLDAALGPAAEPLWKKGRKVRVQPFPGGSLEAFPNLAPAGFRPLRLPWRRIRRTAAWALPLAAGLALACLAAIRTQTRMRELEGREQALRTRVASLQADLDRERALAEALQRLGGEGQAPWVKDLDDLTRLLPEDTRLVDLRWTRSSIQIDLITPKPELIRECLQASNEFEQIAFRGNLERKGEQSRLTLELVPKAGR